MFKIGDKVVCIETDRTTQGNIIEAGEIHVVTEICQIPNPEADGLVFYNYPNTRWYSLCFKLLDYDFVEEVEKQCKPKEKDPLEHLFGEVLPKLNEASRIRYS